MEKLIQELIRKGVSEKALRGMDENTVRNLSKAFGLNPKDFLPRRVRLEISRKNGATYIVTENFPTKKYRNGKPIPGEYTEARNLYIRADCIDLALSDLLQAKSMLSKLDK